MSSGLGYAAGGAVQGFGAGQQYADTMQNDQATSALGAAARVLAGGGQPQTQQPSTPPLGRLMGQQQAPIESPTMGVARSPVPQPPSTVQGQGAQPPVANAASATPQGRAATPPTPQANSQSGTLGTQGTASLSQQTQQPPQQPQQFPVHPEAKGQGSWTFPNLTQALLKANPNLSDRALGKALFLASPLLNQIGLQQYRGAELGLAQERNDIGWANVGVRKDREGRLVDSNAAKQQQTIAALQQKVALAEAKAILEADKAAAGFPPDPEKIKAAEEKYQKAADEAKKQFNEAVKSQEDSGGGDKAELINQAKEAIAQGAPKEKVLARMRQMGLSEQDLQ